MKSIVELSLVAFVLIAFPALSSEPMPGQSHGIAYPTGWKSWSTIAVSYRTDNQTVRTILGNDIAAKAARQGDINPWPTGSIIGKVVWKQTELNNWKAAKVPGKFIHAEFMFKDADKYVNTSGWGWARWVGLEQTPFVKGPQVCIACHTPVKDRDWVFTDPASLP